MNRDDFNFRNDDKFDRNNFRNDDKFDRNNFRNDNCKDCQEDNYENGRGGYTVKNKAFVELEMCGKTHIIESNEVEARKVKITVKEEQSCNAVFAGDEIEYKIKICNDSLVDIFNCEFRDILDDDSELDRNSFKVNGKKQYPEVRGKTICYKIPELKKNEETIITFETKVC